MRLWHYSLIDKGLLPKSQLVAQWRELNSIFANQNRHILINYIYKYPKEYLFVYTLKVIKEMNNRHISIKNYDHFHEYFKGIDSNIVADIQDAKSTFVEHDSNYLMICYYNLKEKFLMGQKDFGFGEWNNLYNYMRKIFGDKVL